MTSCVLQPGEEVVGRPGDQRQEEEDEEGEHRGQAALDHVWTRSQCSQFFLVSSICTVSGEQTGENAAAPGQLCSPRGRGRGAGGGAGADTDSGHGEVSRALCYY